MKFFIVNSQGEIKRILTVSDDSTIELLCLPGETPIEDIPPDLENYWDFEKATWVQKEKKPNELLRWDPAQKLWYDPRNTEELRVSKRRELNTSRKTASLKTFTHGGHTFNCDADSRREMDAVTNIIALTGALPTGWSGTWTDTEGVDFAVATKAVWIAMQQSLFQQLKANFVRARQLKQRLAAASTNAQIDDLSWQTNTGS